MSRFADFIQHSSDEEKERVFGEVMDSVHAEQMAVIRKAETLDFPKGDPKEHVSHNCTVSDYPNTGMHDNKAGVTEQNEGDTE